jgi:hypothetical protein
MQDAPELTLDPSREVPQEYEVFCEGCGYSLLGIATDRCPECGKEYDIAALPFARIPWLHRRRIGRVRAYLATARMVLSSPGTFGRELCRPVRVSVRDARQFRRVTVLLAVASLILTIAGIAAADFASTPGSTFTRARMLIVAVVLVMYAVASTAFLFLATDIPLFIWKGLPSLPPNQLAPVHHYASAPLSLMVVFAPLAAAATLCAKQFGVRDVDGVGALALGAGLIAIAATLMVIPLMLMRAVTRCGPKRLLALALYLPVHWAIMLAMTVLALMLVMQPIVYLINHL